MNDAGYTLTEMLAALAVIGLSIGGLTLGAQVIGALQLSTSTEVGALASSRSARLLIEQWLAQGAPFGSQQPDQLSGDGAGFQFQCAAAAPCSVQVVTRGATTQLKLVRGGSVPTSSSLTLPAPAHFIYRGSAAEGDQWPPADPARQTLRSITLVRSMPPGQTPLLEAKIWSQQRAQCDFDPVLQDCR